jgi:raffinose/stachyose/melibiose transport system permease protein
VEGTRGARRTVAGTAAFVILLAVAAAILVPIVYAVLGGFKDNGQLAGNPVALIPDPWVFDNYADVLWGENAPAFWGELLNSVIVAIIAVGVTVGCASAAAFVFARIRFRGREAMYTLFVFGLLFPTAVAILPLYILIRQLGLSGSLLGVALPQAAFGLPLSIVILRPFFRSIPMELEDAARMDGCGSFGFFWRVLLPLSRPAIATVSVLAIVTTWNAFILPLIVLNSADQWTLPLGVMNFATEYSSDAARTLAFTVVALIPAVIFYAIAERHIVGGLTAGSVKG